MTWATGFTADRFAGEGTTFPVFAVSDPGQLQVRVDDTVGTFGEAGQRARLSLAPHDLQERRGGEERVHHRERSRSATTAIASTRWRSSRTAPRCGSATRRPATPSFTRPSRWRRSPPRPWSPSPTPPGRAACCATPSHRPTSSTFASGTVVLVPDGRRAAAVGRASRRRTTTTWQLVAFDPAAGDSGRAGSHRRGRDRRTCQRPHDHASTTWRRCRPPSASTCRTAATSVLAQLTTAPDGDRGADAGRRGPPGDLAGEGEANNGRRLHVYLFEGPREFTGHLGEARQRRVVHLDRHRLCS